MNMITIGSRLPTGLLLQLEKETHEIKGLNSAVLIGAEYVTTEIPRAFWDAWSLAYMEYPPLKNMSIFPIEKKADEKAIAADAVQLETGLEQIDQESHGVKKADSK